jgi:hypothetical protein
MKQIPCKPVPPNPVKAAQRQPFAGIRVAQPLKHQAAIGLDAHYFRTRHI